MFKFPRQVTWVAIVMMLAIVLVPQSIQTYAQNNEPAPDTPTDEACGATPDTFAGQAFTFNGQSFTFNGQAFTFNGQGFTFNGQAFTFNGQAFTFNGQAFTFNGQAFTFNGQAFTFNGQTFTFNGQDGSEVQLEQVFEQMVTNPIDPAWPTLSFSNITDGEDYNAADSAILVIDETSHGAEVLQTFNALNDALSDLDQAPIPIYFINIETGEIANVTNPDAPQPLPIDVGPINYESDDIAAAIAATVNYLQPEEEIDGQPYFDHLVLNMSFAFIPCEDEETGFDYSEFQDWQAGREIYIGVEAPIVPILECVYQLDNTSYVARFGYDSFNDESLLIDTGANNNLFENLPNNTETAYTDGDTAPPTLFESLLQTDVFEVEFNQNDEIFWRVTSGGVINESDVASAALAETNECDDLTDFNDGFFINGNSNGNNGNGRGNNNFCRTGAEHPVGVRIAETYGLTYEFVLSLFCDEGIGWGRIRRYLDLNPVDAVTPVLECVYEDADTDGLYYARFGYVNFNDDTVIVPVGEDNLITADGNPVEPDDVTPEQPTYFLTGVSIDVYEVEFTDTVSWSIQGPESVTEAVVAAGNIAFLPSCTEQTGYSIGDYLEFLGFTPDQIIEILIRFLTQVDESSDLDALQNLLGDYLQANIDNNNEKTVVTVASSGNFAPWIRAVTGTIDAEGNVIPSDIALPLIPAIWPETIAVGAIVGDGVPLGSPNTPDDGATWFFSHDANILAPGASYLFGVEDPDVITGTSHSAPGAGFVLALYGRYPAACQTTVGADGTLVPPIDTPDFTNAILRGGPASVNPLACNIAPIASDDPSFGVDEEFDAEILVEQGSSVDIDVLSNDFDSDNFYDDVAASDLETLRISNFTAPTYGSLMLINGGTGIQYTHDADTLDCESEATFFDSFSYTVTDDASPAGSDTATVSIEISPEPCLPPSIIGFTLVDLGNGGIEYPLVDDSDLFIADFSDEVTIRADVFGGVSSVMFDDEFVLGLTEFVDSDSSGDFTRLGDSDGVNPVPLENGFDGGTFYTYTITGTAYSDIGGTGDESEPLSVSVVIFTGTSGGNNGNIILSEFETSGNLGITYNNVPFCQATEAFTPRLVATGCGIEVSSQVIGSNVSEPLYFDDGIGVSLLDAVIRVKEDESQEQVTFAIPEDRAGDYTFTGMDITINFFEEDDVAGQLLITAYDAEGQIVGSELTTVDGVYSLSFEETFTEITVRAVQGRGQIANADGSYNVTFYTLNDGVILD